MDSKPDPKITALQRNQIDKMVEMAGEVLFEASAGRWWARGGIKELAHHLGRLYGETIRACRPHEGLKDEVQTTFMCGMALEPNFGREEEGKGGDARLKRGLARIAEVTQEEKAVAEKATAVSIAKVKRNAAMNKMANACWKCTGTGNMSLLGEYEKCDAC